jgi:hypothetical protein
MLLHTQHETTAGNSSFIKAGLTNVVSTHYLYLVTARE